MARDAALEKGIVINGLPIMVKEPSYSTMDIDNLDFYYEDCVIGGPAPSSSRSRTRRQVQEAIRTKLLMEVAGRTPERPVMRVADKEPRVNCADRREDLVGSLGRADHRPAVETFRLISPAIEA